MNLQSSLQEEFNHLESTPYQEFDFVCKMKRQYKNYDAVIYVKPFWSLNLLYDIQLT